MFMGIAIILRQLYYWHDQTDRQCVDTAEDSRRNDPLSDNLLYRVFITALIILSVQSSVESVIPKSDDFIAVACARKCRSLDYLFIGVMGLDAEQRLGTTITGSQCHCFTLPWS